jgi:dTDP-4-dehydrorhamnose reductase
MNLLLTGGKGMLGRTLLSRFSALGHQVAIADLPEVDITQILSFQAAVDAAHPQVIIHCAAMTAVDACETQADLAWKVNALGSANVAICAQRAGARLITISTDYVFDGKLDRPYHEWDATGPATVYGRTKLAGEEAIRTHCPDHVIIRIAWLYGPGGPSFVHTMIKLGVQEGASLKIVNDQLGNPTSTDAVAGLIANLLEAPIVGTVHGSCEGETSWFGFAQEIFRIWKLPRALEPCTTAQFPRPAPRPANSRLEKRLLRLAGLPPILHWCDALGEFAREFPNG